MAIGTLIALALGSIASAAIGAGISAKNNQDNLDYQKEANQQNIDLAREVNAQNQYNMEHAHQIEMKDLEAAGLNPVLTASGGSGAQLANLSTPNVKAPRSDLSGVGSAITSALNSLTMLTMASSMAKNNAALANMREAGRNDRFMARQAAYSQRAQNAYSAKMPKEAKSAAKALKKVLNIDTRDDDDDNWDFLIDPPGY